MSTYLLKRILLIFPTLFFVMLINFLIIQTAPGGPVEQFMAKLNHGNHLSSEVVSFSETSLDPLSQADSKNINSSKYDSEISQKNAIDLEIIKKIEALYGFDLPLWQRFFVMIKKFLTFDFGDSFYQDKKVIDLVIEKLPVSISLGLWSTLLIYLISIPLGIKKAISDGSKFDVATSAVVVVGHAIPSFLFAIFLIIIFAGGNFLSIFPLRGLVSQDFDTLTWWQKIIDYFWHLALPITAMTVGGFASLTFFCKNSFLEEINKQYVLTAAAKGLSYDQILYKHVFRNAMMIVIAGIPAAFIGILFTGAMLIEIIFSLDGLGLLGYESAVSRDYPVMFGALYCFTLIGLVVNIISDLTYKIVDPRISFDKSN